MPKAYYRVMRADEVNTREDQNDRRLYYCDPDVDIVVTTISKRHVDEAHRHITNTEIYYVVRGRLSVEVEGRSSSLEKGDLIIVYPGACHHFETGNEEVCFLAIKKQPLVEDKESC